MRAARGDWLFAMEGRTLLERSTHLRDDNVTALSAELEELEN